MIWREKRLLLAILAVLLVANTIFFLTYRVQYERRLQALDERLHDTEGRLQHAQNVRLAAEQQLRSYNKVRTDLQTLYNERWATKPQRLTPLIEEIKRVAAKSQVAPPKTISFSQIEDHDAQRTGGVGTTTVIISFSVQGNYQQIRRLINSLELSDQFLIIDGINLAGAGSDANLTLNIRLKTLFREGPRSTNVNKET